MNNDEIGMILKQVGLFDKLYDHIRLVDPVSKKIVNYKNNTFTESKIKCFEFWGKSRICDNCVSIRAYNENDTFVKLEYAGNRIFMTTSVPFEASDRRVVIELLKDVTKSLVFESGGENEVDRSQIQTVIDKMNLLALKDPLTGIYNRRYIDEKLPIDLINAVFMEKHLSLIMADIDLFKIVNDTYGHLAGDCVLQSVGETLSGCLKRESDWVARYGGEEFLICLPGASRERAADVAESMRKSVERKEIICGENIIKITASFGICSLKPGKGDSIQALIKIADEKLYLAKTNGRNRVEY